MTTANVREVDQLKARNDSGQQATYQLLPALSDDDFAALKADIKARGVQVPIEYDDGGEVLDGHHRLKACVELGITEWPRVVRSGLSEDEKRQHVRQLNLARRHLTREQKRELIAAQLKDTPEKSNRQIAEGLKVDDKTVGTVRSTLEGRAEIPHVSTVTDTAGRKQPARRTAKPKASKPKASFMDDPDFQAEAEAAARDIEIERDERIALSGGTELAAENERLHKQIGLLDRRIAALINENGSLKYRARMWEKRALDAGWKGKDRTSA